MAFSMQFSFHMDAWMHTSTCGSYLVGPVWVPDEDNPGVLRWTKAWTIMPVSNCGGEGISSDRTHEFAQLKWLPLKHAGFPNALWLKEALTQTEATLSLHAKCAGKAGAKLGCVNGSASSRFLALGQGSLHPHPQLLHGPAVWEELVPLQQRWRPRMAQGMCPAREYVLQGKGCAGLQDPPEEPCTTVPLPL